MPRVRADVKPLVGRFSSTRSSAEPEVLRWSPMLPCSTSCAPVVEYLVEANERLTAWVAELECRLSRNSGNSSMSPSSDTFGRPVKKSGPGPKSGHRRGNYSSGWCCLGWWEPDGAGEEVAEDGEGVVAVFVGGGEVGAYEEPAVGAVEGAPAAADLQS